MTMERIEPMRNVLFAAILATGALAAPAVAQSLDAPPLGKQAGTFIVRLGAAGILPLDSSTHIGVIGGEVRATNSASPEVDLSYFFTDHLAIQVIAASTRHNLTIVNSALGPKLDLGSTWVLPPTVSLQYHVFPHARISPYLGAGANFTFFYDEQGARPIDKFHLSTSVGASVEAGIDYNFAGPLFFNVDAKQIFLTTDARVHALGLLIKAPHALDPTVISTGISFRF